MILRSALLMLLLNICHIHTAEHDAVTFQQLSAVKSIEAATVFQGRDIKVRGFLYHSLDKRWILASEPGLKTCCVGSSRKVWQQILVDGEFDNVALGTVVEMKGNLQVDPKWDEKKDLKQVYRLEGAHIVSEPDKNLLFIMSMIAAGFITLFFFTKRLSKR